VLGALLLTGWQTVSETGRSQLNLVSAEEEMKLGGRSFFHPCSLQPDLHKLALCLGL
jgi:hypothetical protein